MATADPLKDLWTEIKGFLQVRHTVAEKVRDVINVGEPFTLKLTVMNIAPSDVDHPAIRFKNVKLLLQGTYFAELAAGQPAVVDLPTPLGPGDVASVMVKMKALQCYPPITYRMETVLLVTVMSTLDLDYLSTLVKDKGLFQVEQIYPEPVLVGRRKAHHESVPERLCQERKLRNLPKGNGDS